MRTLKRAVAVLLIFIIALFATAWLSVALADSAETAEDNSLTTLADGSSPEDTTDAAKEQSAFTRSLTRVVNFIPSLLYASRVTLGLTAVSVSLGLIGGLFLALGRISKVSVLNKICQFYIWFFRGTPLLMQIYFIYYALPLIHPMFNITNRFIVACVAFSLNSAAYLAEIVRAAIQSIDKGQMEAAKALGMTYTQAMTRVIIPQSIRRLVPPVGNEFVMVLKDTALVSVMGLAELMRVTNQFNTKYHEAMIYLPTMVIYLFMTTLFTFIFGKVEKKYSVYE